MLPFGFDSEIEFVVVMAASVIPLIAFFGQQYQTNSIYRYYASEVPFSPPGWLFGVVWSTLYVLQAVVISCLALKDIDRFSDWIILALFQGFLWLLWPRLFWENLAFRTALLVLLASWVLAAILVYMAYETHEYLAFWFEVLAFLWLTFAAYLNYSGFEVQPLVISIDQCRQDKREREDAACIHKVCGSSTV